jgi:hypothetical protein
MKLRFEDMSEFPGCHDGERGPMDHSRSRSFTPHLDEWPWCGYVRYGSRSSDF